MRNGHDATLYEREAPGAAVSSGNSGVLSPIAVVPVSMPQLLYGVPGWFMDPEAPPTMDWRQVCGCCRGSSPSCAPAGKTGYVPIRLPSPHSMVRHSHY